MKWFLNISFSLFLILHSLQLLSGILSSQLVGIGINKITKYSRSALLQPCLEISLSLLLPLIFNMLLHKAVLNYLLEQSLMLCTLSLQCLSLVHGLFGPDIWWSCWLNPAVERGGILCIAERLWGYQRIPVLTYWLTIFVYYTQGPSVSSGFGWVFFHYVISFWP